MAPNIPKLFCRLPLERVGFTTVQGVGVHASQEQQKEDRVPATSTCDTAVVGTRMEESQDVATTSEPRNVAVRPGDCLEILVKDLLLSPPNTPRVVDNDGGPASPSPRASRSSSSSSAASRSSSSSSAASRSSSSSSSTSSSSSCSSTDSTPSSSSSSSSSTRSRPGPAKKNDTNNNSAEASEKWTLKESSRGTGQLRLCRQRERRDETTTTSAAAPATTTRTRRVSGDGATEKKSRPPTPTPIIDGAADGDRKRRRRSGQRQVTVIQRPRPVRVVGPDEAINGQGGEAHKYVQKNLYDKTTHYTKPFESLLSNGTGPGETGSEVRRALRVVSPPSTDPTKRQRPPPPRYSRREQYEKNVLLQQQQQRPRQKVQETRGRILPPRSSSVDSVRPDATTRSQRPADLRHRHQHHGKSNGCTAAAATTTRSPRPGPARPPLPPVPVSSNDLRRRIGGARQEPRRRIVLPRSSSVDSVRPSTTTRTVTTAAAAARSSRPADVGHRQHHGKAASATNTTTTRSPRLPPRPPVPVSDDLRRKIGGSRQEPRRRIVPPRSSSVDSVHPNAAATTTRNTTRSPRSGPARPLPPVPVSHEPRGRPVVRQELPRRKDGERRIVPPRSSSVDSVRPGTTTTTTTVNTRSVRPTDLRRHHQQQQQDTGLTGCGNRKRAAVGSGEGETGSKRNRTTSGSSAVIVVDATDPRHEEWREQLLGSIKAHRTALVIFLSVVVEEDKCCRFTATTSKLCWDVNGARFDLHDGSTEVCEDPNVQRVDAQDIVRLSLYLQPGMTDDRRVVIVGCDYGNLLSSSSPTGRPGVLDHCCVTTPLASDRLAETGGKHLCKECYVQGLENAATYFSRTTDSLCCRMHASIAQVYKNHVVLIYLPVFVCMQANTRYVWLATSAHPHIEVDRDRGEEYGTVQRGTLSAEWEPLVQYPAQESRGDGEREEVKSDAEILRRVAPRHIIPRIDRSEILLPKGVVDMLRRLCNGFRKSGLCSPKRPLVAAKRVRRRSSSPSRVGGSSSNGGVVGHRR